MWLLLRRKAMTNLDGVLKSRHHSFNKGPYRQGYCLPSSQYSCVSWTREKAECQMIDAFELWCWRRKIWPIKHEIFIIWSYSESLLTSKLELVWLQVRKPTEIVFCFFFLFLIQKWIYFTDRLLLYWVQWLKDGERFSWPFPQCCNVLRLLLLQQ